MKTPLFGALLVLSASLVISGCDLLSVTKPLNQDTGDPAAFGNSDLVTVPLGATDYGFLSTPGGAKWYVASVVAGTSYKIYWDGSEGGSGAATLDIDLTVYQANHSTQYFRETGSSMTGRTITVPGGQNKIYLQFRGADPGDTGSFVYKVEAVANTGPDLTAFDPDHLVGLATDNQWHGGTLSTAGGAVWYEASVTPGYSYLLDWNDAYQGSGAESLDVKVSAFESDHATAYFDGVDSGGPGWTLVVPEGQDKIYLRILAYTNGHTGTFALQLSSGTAPVVGDPSFEAATPLALAVDGSFHGGSLTISGGAVWYAITVVPGLAYDIQWRGPDEIAGTLYTSVSVFHSDGETPYFVDDSSVGSLGHQFTAASGQTTAYIQVQATDGHATGTFLIAATSLPGAIDITIQ